MSDTWLFNAHDFATFIRLLRAREALSLTDFAQKVGVARNTVRFWEKGIQCPNMVTVRRLCVAFDLDIPSVMSLLPYTKNVKPYNAAYATGLLDWYENEYGLNGAQMAEYMGISRQRYHKIKNGNSGDKPKYMGLIIKLLEDVKELKEGEGVQ